MAPVFSHLTFTSSGYDLIIPNSYFWVIMLVHDRDVFNSHRLNLLLPITLTITFYILHAYLFSYVHGQTLLFLCQHWTWALGPKKQVKQRKITEDYCMKSDPANINYWWCEKEMSGRWYYYGFAVVLHFSKTARMDDEEIWLKKKLEIVKTISKSKISSVLHWAFLTY